MDEALLHEEVERAVDRDRREPASAFGRDAVGEIIGPDRLVVGMQRLQRLAADRRQAQAALAAEALGTLERVGGVVTVLVCVAAAAVFRAMIMRGMVTVMVMAVMLAGLGVWLHFGRVALQKDIGQRAAIFLGLPAQAPARCAT